MQARLSLAHMVFVDLKLRSKDTVVDWSALTFLSKVLRYEEGLLAMPFSADYDHDDGDDDGLGFAPLPPLMGVRALMKRGEVANAVRIVGTCAKQLRIGDSAEISTTQALDEASAESVHELGIALLDLALTKRGWVQLPALGWARAIKSTRGAFEVLYTRPADICNAVLMTHPSPCLMSFAASSSVFHRGPSTNASCLQCYSAMSTALCSR